MARHKLHCNYADHVSGDLHSKQVGDRIKQIERLEAENDAYRAMIGKRPDLDDHAELLVALASALRLGEEAMAAHPTVPPTDAQHSRQKPASRPPGGANPAARSATRRLTRTVERAIDSFISRKDNDFHRIDFEEPGPRKRCWTRGCKWYAKTVTEAHICHTDDVAEISGVS